MMAHVGAGPRLSPPCVAGDTTPIKDELSVSLVSESSGFQLRASQIHLSGSADHPGWRSWAGMEVPAVR